MIYKFKLLIIVLFTLIQYKNLIAQKIKFECISARDGLSQASVTCIEQDSLGFLWFGTYDGLNRYDGYDFKVFKKDPQNPNSISHNFIRCSFIDTQGTLWIGTQGGGLNRYDHEKEQFIRYQHDPDNSQSISHNEIYTFFEDHSGNLWIGTWGGGLNKVEYKKSNSNKDSIIFKRFQHDPQNLISLCDNKVSSIQQDKNGMLWIGTRNGISVFDPDKKVFIKRYIHDPENPTSISTDNISNLHIDRYDNIWIATWDGGLNKYDVNRDQFIRFRHDPKNPKSISFNMILSLFTDKLGNFWIGTWGGGLNKLENTLISRGDITGKEEFVHFTHDESDLHSISGDAIYDIFEDRSGVFWFATDWSGINKYNPSNDEFNFYRFHSKIENQRMDNSVFSIYKDKKEILWLGTRSNGLIAFDMETGHTSAYMYNPNDPYSISNNTVRAIYEKRSGELWIGTETGLNRFDQKTKKFYRYYIDPDDPSVTNVIYLYEDLEGYLWLGTWGGGLSKFDPKTKNFTTYQNDPEDPKSIPDEIIWSIAEDKHGQLWLGTDKSGLIKFDRISERFIPYRHDKNDPNTISDDKVLSILIASNDDIWLGTTTGLNRIIFNNQDPEALLNFEYYTVENGLYSNTIQGIMEDNHGKLWLCNGDYLTELNPITNKTRGFHAYDRLQIGEFHVNSIHKDEIKEEMYVGGING